MHAALTVRVGAALSQKIYAYDAKHVPRWGNKHSALQESLRIQKLYYSAKCRQSFSHFCNVVLEVFLQL